MLKKVFLVLIATFIASSVFSKDTAPFEITYVNKTPDKVQKVVDTVVKVWAQYIKSTRPIKVNIIWKEYNQIAPTDKGVAARCQPTSYTYGVFNKKGSDTLYPISLAEKISGRELNGGSPDIIMEINDIRVPKADPTDTTLKRWYLNIDDNVPLNRYDMFTVLLHEFAHGLGFNGSVVLSADKTKAIFSGGKTIFDYYIKNSLGFPLVSVGADTLLKAVSGKSKQYFTSPYIASVNKKKSALLQIESVFKMGNSLYHFSEDSCKVKGLNSLMTPIFDDHILEHIHAVDSFTMAVMASLGWTEALLNFKQPADYSDLSKSAHIAIAKSNFFAKDSICLVYSANGFVDTSHAYLKLNNTKDSLVVDLPSLARFTNVVQYYFIVYTRTGQTVTFPINAPVKYFTYTIGKDVVSPVIEHTRLNSILSYNTTSSPTELSALVYENMAVDSVVVEYYVLKQKKRKQLVSKGWNLYTGGIEKDTSFKDKRAFKYRLIAYDKAKNKGFYPVDSTQYLEYIIREMTLPRLSYVSNFSTTDSLKDFSVSAGNAKGFSIAMPDGFTNNALHTEHPYRCGESDWKNKDANVSIDYIAQLNVPIILQNGAAYMSFDEVVLVEPGTPGTVWGDHGFWDYVIVEGSKDNISWYPFELEGYDSQKDSAWLDRFYTDYTHVGFTHYESKSNGDASLFRHHEINMLQNKFLRPNDTVSIRFRLFSDSFTWGWGWAIDNLKIQPNARTSANDFSALQSCTVYPNPSKNQAIIINIPGFEGKVIEIKVLNSIGITQYVDEQKANQNGIYSIPAGLSAGFYSVQLVVDGQSVATSRLVVQ